MKTECKRNYHPIQVRVPLDLYQRILAKQRDLAERAKGGRVTVSSLCLHLVELGLEAAR